MASNYLKHTMRGAMAATVVAAAVTLNSVPAAADPAPSGTDKLNQANQKAEQLQQQYLKAQDDLKAKQADLSKANDDLNQANADETDAEKQVNQFRGQVDQLVSATYQGASFSTVSALLHSKSSQDYLDQASALQLLAAQNDTALNKLNAAVDKASAAKKAATDAKQRAQSATDAATKILSDLSQQKQAADAAVAEARAALNGLSSTARGALAAVGDMGVYIAPPGAAGDAMTAALSQRGVPYVWGGETPGKAFDCSGLTQYAYSVAGVSIPRSAAAQYTVGKSVSLSDLEPGDLVFYSTGGAAAIHHVSMYIGDGKVVHAPTEGELVQVVPLNRSGSDIYGAKRIAG